MGGKRSSECFHKNVMLEKSKIFFRNVQQYIFFYFFFNLMGHIIIIGITEIYKLCISIKCLNGGFGAGELLE